MAIPWRSRFVSGDGPWMLAAAGIAGLLSLPLLRYHFTWDQGVYATIADTMLRGGVAYRDAWEFRPPGIFAVYAAAFTLFGRSEWGVHALEAAGLAVAGAALVRIASARFGSRPAGLLAAVVLPLLYVPLGHARTAQCESFQMPLLLWALALWPSPGETAAVARRCVAAGLLAGAVALLKTPGALFAGLLLADRIWLDRREPGWKGKWRASALTAAGAAALPIATAAYYAIRGALPELLHAVFVFAPFYAGHGPSLGWSGHFYGLAGLEPFSAPLAALALVGWVLAVSRAPGDALRAGILAATALLIVVLHGRYFSHHGILLIPFVALGIGIAAAGARPSKDPEGRSERTKAWALRAVLAVFAAAVLFPHAYRLGDRWAELLRRSPSWAGADADCAEIQFSYPQAAALADAVRARSSPSDRVFLWTAEPLAYFLSDRRMAGPYSHVGMMLPYFGDAGWVRAFVDRLRRERPRVVVTGGPAEIVTRTPADRYLQELPGMRAFIEAHYLPAGEEGACRIWVRREGS